MNDQKTAAGTRPAYVTGVAMFLLGVCLVVAAASLFTLAATYRFSGPPTCDGEVMSPGDVCLRIGNSGNSADYDEMMGRSQSKGVTLRVVAGVVAGGVGAFLLGFGAARVRSGDSPRATAVAGVGSGAAAVLLAVVAAYLFALGTNGATFGGIGAACAAVAMVWGIGWPPLSRVTTFVTALSLFAVAAYLVVRAATYTYTGPLHGATWDDPMDTYISDLVRQHGDWVRLILAALAGCGGAVMVYASADPLWDSEYGEGRGARTTALVQYLVAAVMVAVTAAFLVSVGTVSAWVAIGFAALLVVLFVRRGITVVRGRAGSFIRRYAEEAAASA